MRISTAARRATAASSTCGLTSATDVSSTMATSSKDLIFSESFFPVSFMPLPPLAGICGTISARHIAMDELGNADATALCHSFANCLHQKTSINRFRMAAAKERVRLEPLEHVVEHLREHECLKFLRRFPHRVMRMMR